MLEELKWVEENVDMGKSIEEVQQFVTTAPGPPAGVNSGWKGPRGLGANKQCESLILSSLHGLESD